MTDRNGKTTTYVYDAINRVTEIHRPNGISTYNTYNARDQIVRLKNTCDECGWVVSQYDYTYDDNGYIAAEKAVESLYDYAWDDKHNGHHEDGRHDDKMPHGTKHNGKHDKDSEYRFQLVETDREFTYDENGRLLSSKEQEENSGLTTYDYTYDKVGNRLSYVKRTQTTKHPNKTDVAESAFYQYNDSNQLVSAKLFDGKKNTTVDYTYDENGNLISEIGEYGVEQVETYYDYTVENRLQAVYDADRLLMAAAYDGDGNRVFQLNYNLHTDEDWKDNSGNGNGNNKDNTGSGNNGNGNSSSGNNGNSGNGNGNSGNNGNGNGNKKENSKSEGTDDAGYGNATNAEEHNSQNQSGILFPVAEEISRTETDLIAMIKTTGKEKDYELIEYILNVNTQYTQVLMELNENGAMDAVYTYGVSRLMEDRFTGESNFYLYDPSGNVAGITDQNGYLWQSYRYDAFGNATFGSPQYDNEYTFNAESYNPNIRSQYLRARYYDMVKGNFLTEDSYLGDIRNPLTLNRYSYCIGNPLFYDDPSGHLLYHYEVTENVRKKIKEDFDKDMRGSKLSKDELDELYDDRLKFYEFQNHIGWWDSPFYRDEDRRIDYIVGYDFSSNKQFVKECVRTVEYLSEVKKCMEEEQEALKLYGNAKQCKDINGNYPAKVDNWMKLYSAPTVAIKGRHVARPDKANRFDWAMPEQKENINKEARDQIIRKGGTVVININNEKNANIFTDQEGRYWVAVGPKVADENADLSIKLLADNYVYGTKMDIHVKDKMWNEYYIPAVLGDLKEHSGPDGLYQTGEAIPSGTKVEEHADGSMIEFLGDKIPEEMVGNDSKSLINRSNNYEILEIIVYDNVLNY